MARQRIALITDSGTNVPEEFCRAHDVRVIPIIITYGDGRSYESGIDITADEVAVRLADEIPKTSLPSPMRVMEVLRQVVDEGFDAVVVVTISSGLSGTWQAVRLAADTVRDIPITVVDTRSIGLAAGLVVIEAAHLIEEGTELGALRDRLIAVSQRTKVFFAPKTLTYLRAGGRISEATYRLGSLLNVKPVMDCDDAGAYRVVAKPRGWKRTLDTEVKLALDAAKSYGRVRFAVCCSAGNDHFDELERKLREGAKAHGIEVVEVVRGGFAAELLVHTGPDVCGVACQGLD